MAALNNERVVQTNFIFLSAVLTKESILFQSRVNFFFYLVKTKIFNNVSVAVSELWHSGEFFS